MEAPLTAVILSDSLGCLFIGEIFASILFGATTLQTYIYFDNCKDRRTLKSSIGLLWILDATHLGFSIAAYYWYGVINSVDPAQLTSLTWSLKTASCLATASDTVIRSIYLYRIRTMSNKGRWVLVMVVFTSILMILQIGLEIVVVTRENTFTELLKLKWIVCLFFSSSAMADIIITITLCYLLWCHRTNFKRTNGVIHVLIMYTINTGALTSTCSILTLIAYVTMPHNLVFVLFFLVMPELYTNSILAMLNARGKIRENNVELISIPLTRLEEGDHSYSKEPTADKRCLGSGALSVQVNTVVTTDRDPSLRHSFPTHLRAMIVEDTEAPGQPRRISAAFDAQE